MAVDEARDEPVHAADFGGFAGPAPEASDAVAAMRAQFLDFYAVQHEQLVRFVMFSRPASIPAAQDAAQEAFLEAWRAVQRPGGWEEIRNPSAWIRTVALRSHDHPRSLRRKQPCTVAVGEDLLALLAPSQPDPADLAAQIVDVLKALQALHDEEAQAVMAFTLDGFTATDIAYQLNIDTQRVRNLRKKARAFLALHLATSHAQEGDPA